MASELYPHSWLLVVGLFLFSFLLFFFSPHKNFQKIMYLYCHNNNSQIRAVNHFSIFFFGRYGVSTQKTTGKLFPFLKEENPICLSCFSPTIMLWMSEFTCFFFNLSFSSLSLLFFSFCDIRERKAPYLLSQRLSDKETWSVLSST